MTFYQTPLLEGLKTAVSNNMNGIDDDVLLQEPTEENVVYWWKGWLGLSKFSDVFANFAATILCHDYLIPKYYQSRH